MDIPKIGTALSRGKGGMNVSQMIEWYNKYCENYGKPKIVHSASKKREYYRDMVIELCKIIGIRPEGEIIEGSPREESSTPMTSESVVEIQKLTGTENDGEIRKFMLEKYRIRYSLVLKGQNLKKQAESDIENKIKEIIPSSPVASTSSRIMSVRSVTSDKDESPLVVSDKVETSKPVIGGIDLDTIELAMLKIGKPRFRPERKEYPNDET